MRRRTFPDALQPLDVPAWLVIRNGHRQPLEFRQLPAGADLRGILDAAHAECTAAGWECTPVGRCVGFFFAERSGVRHQFAIERHHPHDPGPMHSDPREP